MITTYHEISYFGFDFDRKTTYRRASIAYSGLDWIAPSSSKKLGSLFSINVREYIATKLTLSWRE